MLPDEMQPPKTKFLPRDRSKETRSSSRLKGFPAEKIRKLDTLPMFMPEPIDAVVAQQDPRETVNLFASSIAKSNNGQGDAISAQVSPFYQQSKLQDTSSSSQQPVRVNHQQISQTNPQSENLLTRRIASPERQLHRPFVPTALQAPIIHDRSPRNPSAMVNQPIIIPSSSTQVTPPQMQQFSNDLVVDENRGATSVVDTCGRQPVGGRNAVNYQQIIMQRQMPVARDASAPLNRSASNCHQAQPHDSFQQNPHQVYQQGAYHPRVLQQPHIQTSSLSKQEQQQQQTHDIPACRLRYVNRQLSAPQICGQGMTSPQDMTVSQMKLMQHGLRTHQQVPGYPINLQAAWPQNDRPWMQTTSQNWQAQQSSLPSASRCQCCHPMQAAPNASFDQQSFRNQDQSSPQRNCMSANQQSLIQAQDRQDADKKTLKFTADMIRDQELLISTLRQQGAPDGVMSRHFDALLNEQRRRLAYIAQFQMLPREDAPADADVGKSHRPARRRITNERDEKPEWMMHITPPRISRYEVERIREQSALTRQCTMDDQPREEIDRSRVQQQDYHPMKQEGLTDQVAPFKQMYCQVNPYQQRMAGWSHEDTPYCSHGHQQNAPNSFYQPNLPANVRYSFNTPRNPYYHPEQQKTWPEQHDSNPLKPMNDQRRLLPESARFYGQSGRQAGPSSLLKMRVYKEMICPQRRNNGLQDSDTIQKALEALKDPTSRRGLEYLANLTKRKPAVKLNGTQEPGKIPDDLRLPENMETSAQIQKRILANGLENRRNPNNLPPRLLRPKRADEPAMIEYPPQRNNTGKRYSVQAERENGTVATTQQQDHAGIVSCMQGAQLLPYDPRNAAAFAAQNHCGNYPTICQYGAAPFQRQCQMQQQCYLDGHVSMDRNGGQGDIASMRRLHAPGTMRIDRAGGDTSENLNAQEATKRRNIAETIQGTNCQSEVREARTIGGVTYLPRKPDDYACNNLSVSPDQLIARRHLQPPKIL